uniref:Peroxisomal multifunctional enzyme type 2-like N-terminal domain-containing protein n=1 Tax=Salmo trutta TaxID=8032 RepID=A0A673YMX0_SALTR
MSSPHTVNDLGRDIKGGGKSSAAADKVDKEIKANGGKAVANYGGAISQSLDAVSNSILPVSNFSSLYLIHRLHLRGSFMVTRGQKHNIHYNTITPTAGSRLTETVLPPDLLESLKQCQENEGLLEVGAGWIGKLRWERSQGRIVRHKNQGMSPEAVRDQWDNICDFTNATKPANISGNKLTQCCRVETDEGIVPNPTSAIAATAASGISPMEVVGQKLPESSFSYSQAQCILYDLGVGLSTKDHLKFLYEGNEDFSCLPTFWLGSVPGLNFDLTRVKAAVADVLDKGSGAVILLDVHTYSGKELVFYNQYSLFIVGAGGFGGKRTSAKAMVTLPILAPPNRAPDAVMTDTTKNQVCIYLCLGLLSKGYMLPGQSLQTDVCFIPQVKDSGAVILSGAYVDLHAADDSAEILPELSDKTVFWCLSKKGPYSGKTDVTITVSNQDLMEVVQEKLNPQNVLTSLACHLKPTQTFTDICLSDYQMVKRDSSLHRTRFICSRVQWR